MSGKNFGKFQQVKAGIVDFSKKYLTLKSSRVIAFDDFYLNKTKPMIRLYIAFFYSQYNLLFSQVNTKIQPEKIWVDSVYNAMNFDEKLGQLFMVAAYSNKNEAHAQDLEKLITQYKIGGLIFFKEVL